MDRRNFLAGTAASAMMATQARAASNADIPIIDNHIHLFDGSRPIGAPYKGSREFQTSESKGVSLPGPYSKLVTPLGIVGAMHIDASPWIEDNLWVLEVAQANPFIVGVIGNLQPDKPEFADYLARYKLDPLFRGIRYGNVWGYDLPNQVNNPTFMAGLKLMADAGLVLDTANQRINLLQAALKVNDQIPNLRIVLDHLPPFTPKPEEQSAYDAVMKEMEKRPNIYAKLSGIIHRVNGAVGDPSLAAYRDRLDLLTGTFGEDRVFFGSDYPNNYGAANMPDVVGLVRQYYADKPRAAAEKFFWKNSQACYKWAKRTPKQPSAV